MSASGADAPIATVESPRRVGDEWLVAVALTSAASIGARSAYLSKTPTAVVLVGADRVRAFRIDGSACDVTELVAEVPELRVVVASLAAPPR